MTDHNHNDERNLLGENCKRELMRFHPDRLAESKSGGWKCGVNQQHPNAYQDIVKAIWENRDQLGYAWRILRDGCCDGCGLGTNGLRDWTMKGVHLCNIRLQLLRFNTAPEIDYRLLEDAAALKDLRLDTSGTPTAPRLRWSDRQIWLSRLLGAR